MSTAKEDAFTLVFAGDIRAFDANPFHVETPFGRAYAAGMGDAFVARDDLDDIVAELSDLLRQALASRAPDYADAAHPGWGERTRAALAKAENTP